MIRMTILYSMIGFVCLISLRDWFKGLCGLIILLAFVEHPEMPKGIFGIQGLSAWNIVMVFVLAGYMMNRKDECQWDMPRKINVLLALYVSVIVIAYLRFIVDLEGMVEYTQVARKAMDSKLGLTSEHLINPLKWLVPGALLFLGCKNEKRFREGLIALLAMYLLLALQIIRWMPLSELAGGENFAERALRVLAREIGYHRVDLSMILAGAFWAMLAAREYAQTALVRLAIPFLVAITFLGQALTGGRAGYVTWAGVGFAFAWLKWRKYLILAPIAVVLLIGFVPAVQDRLLEGFDESSIDDRSHTVQAEWLGDSNYDFYTVTAGRVIAWPFVVEKIAERPFVGYGRRAMQREGIATFLLTELGESFPHPHNAYLEFTLDNGLIGFFIVMTLFFHFGIYSMRLMVGKQSRESVVAGAVCFALMLALAIGAIGSQTFYPREGTVGMWCAIGMMMRMHVLVNGKGAPTLPVNAAGNGQEAQVTTIGR